MTRCSLYVFLAIPLLLALLMLFLLLLVVAVPSQLAIDASSSSDSPQESIAREGSYYDHVLHSADRRIALEAFRNKMKPVWTGK